MKRGNCYDSDDVVDKFDLLIAESSEFDLTKGKVYVAFDDSFCSLVDILNDKGQVLPYSVEHFRFYEGETLIT